MEKSEIDLYNLQYNLSVKRKTTTRLRKVGTTFNIVTYDGGYGQGEFAPERKDGWKTDGRKHRSTLEVVPT